MSKSNIRGPKHVRAAEVRLYIIPGLASMAKLAITMQERVIPANLHYRTPNKFIPGLMNGQLEVVSKNTPWNGGYIGLNSFGFGGANAHLILKSHDGETLEPQGVEKPRLFVYGSRTAEGVEQIINVAQQFPRNIHLHKLLNETAHMPPETHPYRGFTVLNSDQISKNVKVSSLVLVRRSYPSIRTYYLRSHYINP